MHPYIEFAANHWILFVALAFIIVLLIATEVIRRLQGVNEITPLAATQMFNHNNALLLDIRENNEFKDGRIGGATHIPLGALEGRLKELEKFKNRPIIAYCRTGQRSARACAVLRKHGFENVYNLGGGLVAWQNASLPVNKNKPPSNRRAENDRDRHVCRPVLSLLHARPAPA